MHAGSHLAGNGLAIAHGQAVEMAAIFGGKLADPRRRPQRRKAVKPTSTPRVTKMRQARRKLGVVPQELVFDPFFNVREALRFQSGYFGVKHNDAWIDELLDSLGLADKAGANMRQLSGGMKRRVLVAQALVHKPPVIVLDEPTAGVDVELRQTLWQFIARLNKEGHTVLLTTHYLEEAEALCQRIAMLKLGRVVALDATTGKEAWVYKLPSGSPSTRGVEYFPRDARPPPRIVIE